MDTLNIGMDELRRVQADFLATLDERSDALNRLNRLNDIRHASGPVFGSITSKFNGAVRSFIQSALDELQAYALENTKLHESVLNLRQSADVYQRGCSAMADFLQQHFADFQTVYSGAAELARLLVASDADLRRARSVIAPLRIENSRLRKVVERFEVREALLIQKLQDVMSVPIAVEATIQSFREVGEKCVAVNELRERCAAADTRVAALEQELVSARVAADARVAALEHELVSARGAAAAPVAALEHELVSARGAAAARVAALEHELVSARAAVAELEASRDEWRSQAEGAEALRKANEALAAEKGEVEKKLDAWQEKQEKYQKAAGYWKKQYDAEKKKAKESGVDTLQELLDMRTKALEESEHARDTMEEEHRREIEAVRRDCDERIRKVMEPLLGADGRGIEHHAEPPLDEPDFGEARLVGEEMPEPPQIEREEDPEEPAQQEAPTKEGGPIPSEESDGDI
jgi:hypothetical protein